jgi:hypothetical protein
MEEEMSESYKELYGEYFSRYHTYLSSLFGQRGPVVLQDKQLYRKFNHALLAETPYASYIVSPLRYTIYHILFKLTPTGVRDWLVHRFVQMPEWKPLISPPEWQPEIHSS